MAENLTTKIELSHGHYIETVKFAMKLWYAGKPKGDWCRTGTQRDIGKYITDHSIGKLAEIAFTRFLEVNWGIRAKLDFDIHPGTLNIDSCDLVEINCNDTNIKPLINIDVKSTKIGSLWAMVDLYEFNNRKYDAYVWVKDDLPLNHLARSIFEAIRNGNMEEVDKLIPSLEIIDAEVIGFAWREEVESWREFRKGEQVFDPNSQKRKLFTPKTDNKACPIYQLRNSKNDWDELIEKICGVENAR